MADPVSWISTAALGFIGGHISLLWITSYKLDGLARALLMPCTTRAARISEIAAQSGDSAAVEKLFLMVWRFKLRGVQSEAKHLNNIGLIGCVMIFIPLFLTAVRAASRQEGLVQGEISVNLLAWLVSVALGLLVGVVVHGFHWRAIREDLAKVREQDGEDFTVIPPS